MPRSFDSADGDGLVLRFTENVDCPACGTTFEGVFHDQDQSITVEDMTEPPVGEHECPACGHRWASAATGWAFFSEAG